MVELAALFDTIFEATTDGIIVYDRDGLIIQANTAIQKIFEMQPEDLLGKFYYQLINSFRILNDQRQLLALEQLPVTTILRGETQEQLQQRDILVRLTCGREVLLNVRNAPILDQHQHLLGCVSLFRDITQQRQKENHILQAFTSLLTLVEALAAIPEPINQLQGDKEDRDYNSPITAAGTSLANVISQVLNCRYVDVFILEAPDERHHLIGASGLSPAQKQQLHSAVEQTRLSDQIDAEAITQLHANHVALLDLKYRPFITKRADFGARYRLIAPMQLRGQLIGLFIIAKTDDDYADLSSAYTKEEIALAQGVAKLTALVIERVNLQQGWAETRASELALLESNSHYDSFVSLASHELRAPLTTIKGNVELALRRLEKLIKQEGQVQTLITTLERIRLPLIHSIQRTHTQARMISDLLDTSRIQKNELTMLMQPCNLVEIVRNTIEDIQLLEQGRNIIFQPPPTENIEIHADIDRISQVVINFISNAIKYSPYTEPIEIYLEQGASSVRVSVHDQGPGLSLEDQLRIWDRFYQSPKVVVQNNAGISGLGLGLYLSRTIIECHHGQIGIHSIEGAGSTFWFSLPLAD